MTRTPLEDFTTEILVGILASNPKIGDAFVNKILQIEGSGFSFGTQEFFLLDDPDCPDCRVDLVIRGVDILCFVEHKVESREGYLQLERYIRVLDDYAPQLRTYLKYCSKYYDHKEFDRHDFNQFRWSDVYRFLVQWRSSAIIEEFLAFLNEHDMSDNMDFNLNDLLSLQELNPVIKKMDRYLEKLRSVFNRFFDRNKLKEPPNLRQIREHARYILLADFVFGDQGYAELGFGFDLGTVPSLKVWIWTDHKNDQRDAFKAAIQIVDFSSNQENWIGLSKPLSDLISSENTEVAVEQWFADAFGTIKTFKEKTPHLNWHI